VTAACLNAQNARPALRLAGRKTASGIFLRTAQTRVRKPRRKSLHTRRVEASAATKSASGVRYYGRRYYNPTLGRWLGRDPIAEKGGLHLYGFVRNNGVNAWDVLGMCGGKGEAPCEGGTLPAVTVGGRTPFDFRQPNLGNSGNLLVVLDGFGGDSADKVTVMDKFVVTDTRVKASIVDPECGSLGERLNQARSILARNNNYFVDGGQYAPVTSYLNPQERAIAGITGPGDSPESSFTPFDQMNLIVGTGSAGASIWQYTTGSARTQTSVALGRGMTGFNNPVGLAKVAGGVGYGMNIASTTMSFSATLNADDASGAISNGAATALGVIGMVPGPVGLGVSLNAVPP
jgi:RHS repeat-associated protein